jgi:SAM-dependent methyltransferase
MRARYLVGRAEVLPLDDASVDVVVFMRSLHHVPCEQLPGALREAARVLRPGGLVYVAEPLTEGAFFELVSMIEDEREARLAAQRALDQAALARLERLATVEYDVRLEIASVDALRTRVVSVDRSRAAAFDACRAELQQALSRLGEPCGPAGARCFLQPMRADVLRVADQAGAAASS